MGSCIICGTSVEGHICETHQQDVVFEFRGTSADQLTSGRFYRGTVDGYAEFGVFIDIGDSVTGLLHRSELDQRLESLAWEAGDSVFVQVQNVRDNGNVDLGWSIRQSEREFRGTLIDDPDEDHALLKENVESDDDGGPVRQSAGDPTGGDPERRQRSSDADGDDGRSNSQQGETASGSDREGTGTESPGNGSSGGGAVTAELQELPVEELADNVGANARIEGEVVDIRQTSGPTVFELRDETGVVDCAAFEEAGVRAYPEVENGDVVRLDGEVRERRGELQVETEALVVLDGEEADAVTQRMDDALEERARPDDVEPLAADDAVGAVLTSIRDAATAIRQAVLEDRPVVVRHNATTDGYVAGVAIERATLPLVDDQHTDADAEYHYFDRRPLEDGVYDMADATTDVTGMLDNRERHDEKLPLFVFAAAGATEESLDGFELLSIYGAEQVVVDTAAADEAIEEAVDTVVSPSLTGVEAETTASALAANVAAHVNDDVREDLGHLPAVSFWEDTPEAYTELAGDSGYDADAVREIREAIALEAFYQSYEDKRELIIDLLFEKQTGLAAQVAGQFRTKLESELDTATANLDERTVDDAAVTVLDTDAYTHEYDFPPTRLLLDELHRRLDADVVIGVGTDELRVRTDSQLDLEALVAALQLEAPDAGVTDPGARDPKVEFLAGEREAVLDAVVDAVAERALAASA